MTDHVAVTDLPPVTVEKASNPLSLEYANTAPALNKQTDKLDPVAGAIAKYGEFTADQMDSHGQSWHATREALQAAGIDAPHGNAADIEQIPGMTRLDPQAKLQPGDVVVVGPQDNGEARMSKYGNSFIVTPNGQAASDHMSAMPDLSKYNDVRIFRHST